MTVLVPMIAAGALGAILGSFVNALSFRYGTGVSALKGRSRCMHCGHILGALDLIPILSFIWLGGSCRYCKSRISFQYPLVEFLAASAAVVFFLQFGFTVAFFFSLVIAVVLLFAAAYDLRHLILPPEALMVLGCLSLGSLFIACDLGTCHAVFPNYSALLAGPLLGIPLLAISFFSGGKWMGWGDGFLELSLGWFLGFSLGLAALFIAFWSGAIVGLVLVVYSKQRKEKKGITIKSEIPFAPFLIFGAAIVYLFHVDLLSILQI